MTSKKNSNNLKQETTDTETKQGQASTTAAGKDSPTSKDNTVKTDPKSTSESPTEASSGAADAQTTDSTPTDSSASDTPSTTEPNATKETTTAEPKQKAKGSKTGIVAIVVAIILSGGLYYYGQQEIDAQHRHIAMLEKQLDDQKLDLRASEERMNTSATQMRGEVSDIRSLTDVRIEQQEQSVVGLQRALADVEGRRPNDWLLAEADYLLKMAGRKLWLEHDVASATMLVQSADVRLAELNDPSLMPIRRAMASDITSLKSVEVIDRDGLVLALTSLQQQIDTLPLSNAIIPAAEAQAPAAVSSDISDWQNNLKTSLVDFSENFITYRKRDGDVIPLLTPDQHFYLKENIKSKLETAIKSVYREQETLYNTSLTIAGEWSADFFDSESPAVQSFLQRLDELSQQTIEVDYPEALQSQPLVSDMINERVRTMVTSINDTEGA